MFAYQDKIFCDLIKTNDDQGELFQGKTLETCNGV